MELVLGLVSIGVALLIWYLQRQKARVRVEVQIETKPFDPRQERGIIYSNSNADKAVDIKIHIKSKYKALVQIQSSIIAVPKLLRLTSPSFLIRNWPVVDNIPLEYRGCSLPVILVPGEELTEAYLPGLAVAQALQNRGYSGHQVVMIGFFDEYKNSYYSKPFEPEVESWLSDRGDFLMGFF